ncbi:MAG: sugar nucleotide-binding protein, partial [Candidatus Parcubacteria bacterium]|nr:sugar nucleotide-binding protein [Candidatus Parcubacteria bacterium]
MAKILVLGKTGMLGSMVYKYLNQSSKHTVVATTREQLDVDKFFVKQDDFSYLLDFDYIINCIGIIKPYCKDTNPIGKRKAILVNALFP